MMNHVNVDVAQSLLQNPAGTPVSGSLAAGTYFSADQHNSGHRGVRVVTQTTSGSGTITTTIQFKEPISGNYIDMLTSLAATPTFGSVLVIYPGMTNTANAYLNDVLSATWRIKAVIATNPVTATIGASLII